MSLSLPVNVPLTTDTVAPCRLTFGWLGVAGPAEHAPGYVSNALFFEVQDAGTLGRVTFEGLDSIRASRGEVAPYDDRHDFSSWVYTVQDSAWLAERHEYEWINYQTPLLDTHEHYLFRFHDEFVEAIAAGIWLDLAPESDPFLLDEGHPMASGAPLVADARGVTQRLAWEVRRTTRSNEELLTASRYCSQLLFDYTLHLDGQSSTSASALLRTRRGITQSRLTRPWAGTVATIDGIAEPGDFAPAWQDYCHGVAQRRIEMGR